jgi:putative oxidoreductase
MPPAILDLCHRAARFHGHAAAMIDRLQPLFALALRIYIAHVFFFSGLTKLHDWNLTLALFSNEYQVPLLPPAVAAVLGTCAELGLPVLLLAGFGTRLAAVALFAFNVVAAVSYPGLSPAGLKDHILWAVLLLVLAVYGPGRLSIDHVLLRGKDDAK